jgi:hypothetical protein
MKKWTEEELKKIEQQLWGGDTLSKVADIHGVTRERMRQLFPKITKEKKLVKDEINKNLRIKRIKRVFKKDIHGTYTSYSRGCRCDKCKKANNEYHKIRIDKLRSTKIDFKHGYGGYVNYKCRCELCITEYKQYQKQYQLKKKGL